MSDGSPAYVVEVKDSARRHNQTAAEWVAHNGRRRTFPSKQAARSWARQASRDGEQVWVQDAVPSDLSDVDGYLVAGDRPPGERDDEDEQWWLPDFFEPE
ncbi:hypothetical protein [Halospeciosus flavus]|uniref:DUF8081 domain-containing protein n=1 Tax=Halospeciosus flavus TaxID=3032283 RepID=A0ABD5Z6I4_9EURY|nr:hypothetical protein [Halospeciosus flavus]